MTLPSLIATSKEKETVVKVKKAYSVLSNAFNLAINEHGEVDSWDLIAILNEDGVKNIAEKVSKYLNIQKDCGVQNGCFPDVIYKNLKGGNDSNYNQHRGRYKIIMNDGMLVAFDVRDPNCEPRTETDNTGHICGVVYVDINGFKPPNQNGLDTFQFYIKKRGLALRGIPTADYNHSDDCSKAGAGYGCSGWVVMNGNMEYLKCNELDWNKAACKK